MKLFGLVIVVTVMLINLNVFCLSARIKASPRLDRVSQQFSPAGFGFGRSFPSFFPGSSGGSGGFGSPLSSFGSMSSGFAFPQQLASRTPFSGFMSGARSKRQSPDVGVEIIESFTLPSFDLDDVEMPDMVTQN